MYSRVRKSVHTSPHTEAPVARVCPLSLYKVCVADRCLIRDGQTLVEGLAGGAAAGVLAVVLVPLDAVEEHIHLAIALLCCTAILCRSPVPATCPPINSSG